MVSFCKKLAEALAFRRFIIFIIIAAGVLIGLETYPDIAARHHATLHILDQIILWIFAAEITIKLIAHGGRFWRFFYDPWNVFDFIVVAVCFLPLDAQFAAVLRLVRVLRVLRLLTTLPKLQILVGALLKSIPSMGYVALLLFLHFYIYAVVGAFLFGKNDPIHFGSLPVAMLTLFKVVTLEGWVDIMNIQFYGAEGVAQMIHSPVAMPVVASLYFVSFILLGTMIIMNLLIGVIMSGMQEMQAELATGERRDHVKEIGHPTAHDELNALELQLDELKKNVDRLRHRLAQETHPSQSQ